MDKTESNVFLTDFLHQVPISNAVPKCPLMHIVFVEIKKKSQTSKNSLFFLNLPFPLRLIFSY